MGGRREKLDTGYSQPADTIVLVAEGYEGGSLLAWDEWTRALRQALDDLALSEASNLTVVAAEVDPPDQEAVQEVLRAWKQRLGPGDLLAPCEEGRFVACLVDRTPRDAASLVEALHNLAPGRHALWIGGAVWNRLESSEQLFLRAQFHLDEALESGLHAPRWGPWMRARPDAGPRDDVGP